MVKFIASSVKDALECGCVNVPFFLHELVNGLSWKFFS